MSERGLLLGDRAIDRPSSPFDDLADDYDRAFTATVLGQRLRGIVRHRAARLLGPEQHVLEVGCGTGEDALWLAQQGHRVTATDASAGMLRAAMRKAARCRGADRIEFVHSSAAELAPALRGRSFDAVFSNFGAINCVGDLNAFVADLASLLRPGASLIWVVMGRRVPWEWIWFLSRFDARNAFRRLGRDGTRWRGARIIYPSNRTLRRLLDPHFVGVAVRPLGVVLPPTYAARWIDRWPRLFARMAQVDAVATRSGFLAGLADHVIIEARRAGD